MADELILVGSIPMDTAEEVFRTFAPALGDNLAYIPDGEINDRRYWIEGIAYRVLHGHPELETLKRPAPDEHGPDTWRPLNVNDRFDFKVKDGVKTVRFGDPGWRLGYTKDAIASYFVFKTLKRDGVIPKHVRFQVCMPSAVSACASHFPDPADRDKVVPGMAAAFRAEIAEMVRHIPPAELAIQWDLAVENRFVETAIDKDGLDAGRAMADWCAETAGELCAAIPPETAVGIHNCFSTINGWPSRQPADMTGSVMVLNPIIAAAGRKVDFIHFPTVGAASDSFFKPLKDLDVRDARIYVGSIHHLHGKAGMRAQLEAVKRYIPDFGLGAPCGFGRAPERPGRLLTDEGDAPPPDIIRVILDDHKKALEILHDVLG